MLSLNLNRSVKYLSGKLLTALKTKKKKNVLDTLIFKTVANMLIYKSVVSGVYNFQRNFRSGNINDVFFFFFFFFFSKML